MKEINFLEQLHESTSRDYIKRVQSHDKAHCAEFAKQWGYDYWDGDRQYGYGGYSYDGRWRQIAEKMAQHYSLRPGDKILDVGCGKGYLLYEFTQIIPGIEVHGVDLSEYAKIHAKEEIKVQIKTANATALPFDDNYFDLVISLTTLHNLYNFELMDALKEVQRVGKKNKYISVESYRNEKEKVNLLYWQLTCESFYNVVEWKWFYDLSGYDGDYGFIFFQ